MGIRIDEEKIYTLQKRNPPKSQSNSDTPSPLKLDSNILAVISYIFPVVGGILIFNTYKSDKLARFHSLQSVLFWVASWGIVLMCKSLKVIIIGEFLLPVAYILIFISWLYTMAQAFNNVYFELPIIGSIAKDHSQS